MKITCISDLHGHHPQLEGGDLLIVAGDLTARDTVDEYIVFNTWLSKQNYDRKIVIAGNHDGLMEKGVDIDVFKDFTSNVVPVLADRAIYLQDSGCEFEGLKIWGSPWTPTFFDWHFMKDRGDPIKQKWDLIPGDIDILVTHGPPFGILDKARKGQHCGCEDLLNTLSRLDKLKLHVFGHIHEGYGQMQEEDVRSVNCSIMDARYRPVNKPITINL